MVDLHSHILPNIDDGASSYEEALDMLRVMVENGVSTVVATPHFNFEKNNVDDFILQRTDAMNQLKLLSNQENLPIKILSGAELMFSPNISNYDLEEFTIEDTDYILIELSTKRNEPELEYSLSAIIANGYIPILAHIERYQYLVQNSQRIVDLINLGVLMQINANSLYSKKKYPFVPKLIKKKLVHIISSDAHDMAGRLPNLVHDKIEDRFISNQSKIIENITLSVDEPRKLIRFLNIYIYVKNNQLICIQSKR